MKFLISSLITIIIVMGVGLNHLFNKTLQFEKNLNHVKKKNERLVKQQKQIKNKIRNNRKLTTKKYLKRAEKKIATAPAKMIPIVGITVIMTMTAYDIKNYCDDIQNLKQFEYDLFGVPKNNSNTDEEKICGMNIEKELKPFAQNQYASSINWINESSQDMADKIKNKFYQTKEIILKVSK